MNQVGKIPLFVNPLSRINKLRKGKSIREFREAGQGLVEVIAPCSFDELDDAVARCRREGISILAISGGDGSIHQVLTRFIREYGSDPLPPVLLLKDGTMNNISRTINLKGSGLSILKRYLARVRRGDAIGTVPRNTLRIEDRYCFLFGNGLVTNVLDAVYDGGSKGLLKRIRVFARAIWECASDTGTPRLFKRFHGRVALDGSYLPCEDFIGVLAGTVETVGMGFSPLAPRHPGERSFHVIATALSPREVLRYFIRLKRGKPIPSPRHFYRHVSSLRMESPEGITYTMDGDLYHASGHVEVDIGPVVNLVYV
ncbi:MAG: hypothetical protein EPN93_02715 [Spirochaetes bacterium]|nr:MAG: hypothetical protein EPN93_02715 [Spirochaetota bacterium]